MASGKIKGVTIEFRGDATPLEKALREVKATAKSTENELKQIDKAIKFNPTNIDAWRQKQTVLNKAIAETKEKLSVMKKGLKEMEAQGMNADNSEEFRRMQREIDQTERRLKGLKSELRSVGNVNLRVASEQFKQLGTNLDTAGQKLRGFSTAAAVVAGSLGATAVKAGKMADDVNTLSKVTGIGTDELQKYGYAADLVDVSVESIAKSNKRLTKSAYSAQQGSKAQSEAFEKLGVSVTDSQGNLRDSEAIFQDVIASLGKMTNETERDALAQTLMGKSAAELNPLIEDGGETYKKVADTLKKYDLEFVDQKTLDQANEFNDTLDTMKLMGSVAIAQVGSQLAAQLVPAMEKVVGWAGKLAKWLGNLDPKVLSVITAVAGLVAALAPVLMFLGKISFAISSILSLVSTVGPVLGGLLGPIGLVVAAIAGAITVGVLLYKNWDTIKAKIIAIWNAIKKAASIAWTGIKNIVIGAFNGLKSAANTLRTTLLNVFRSIGSGIKSVVSTWFNIITAPYKAAWNLIKGIAEKIRNVFNFDFKLPKIKLPHFSIQPRGWKIGDLLKGSIPSLDVEWYAKGGIFNSPSVIGVGEAGPEAVLPIDKISELMPRIDYERLAVAVAQAVSQVSVKGEVSLDGKAVGRVITPTVNKNMYGQSVLDGRFA